MFDKARGYFLTHAENVDLDTDGSLVVRREPELVQAMTAPHSMFGRLMVRASTLYSITLHTSAAATNWLEASGIPRSSSQQAMPPAP